MKFELKAVVFDVQASCRELKRQLSDAGILVIVPFFGLQVEAALKEAINGIGVSASDCLLITNQAAHSKVGLKLGMAVAGCMEGHFEVPEAVTLLEEPEEVSVSYLNQLYCHVRRLPATVAETERCYIRELTAENMDVLYEILTDEEVSRYLPAKAGSREEELEKLISYVACVYPFFEYGYWGVFLKESGELIGRAGFKEGIWPLEVGYAVRRSLWGQGFGTEILGRLIQYAEEELAATELLAKIDERNMASLRVADKCGFYETEQTAAEEKRNEAAVVKTLRFNM